jgi:membrane fusion protein, type I secretion system
VTAQDPQVVIRRLNLMGLALVVLCLGGASAWAVTVQLAGAVTASGTIVVATAVKKVQHPTGGIVGQILVKEGDEVEAGQVVLRLDDTMTRANLGIVRSQLDAFMAREARLLAERDDAAAIAFPQDLIRRRDDETINKAIAGEEKLFDSRRTALAGQRAQLRERIVQSNEEIRGLLSQQAAKESELALIEKELAGVAELYGKNLVSISKYTLLQRDQTRLRGEHGQLIAAIAQSRGKISETKLKIIQLDHDFLTDVLNDLREAQGNIAKLRDQVTAAEDQLMRVDLRAPREGVVHRLTVHTVGGVIDKGETVMQIVPRTDELVIEAKLNPSDVDQVATGANAMVRIMAGNSRLTPQIIGVVTRAPADLASEQVQKSAQPASEYYTVRVVLPAEEVARLGDLHLLPGMAAEVFIRTPERTPLEILLKPLREQIARAFRER